MSRYGSGHFTEIAELLKKEIEESSVAPHIIIAMAQRSILVKLTRRVAKMFGKHNEAFDESRFFEEVGISIPNEEEAHGTTQKVG